MSGPIINPRTGDKHAAEDILNDLCQVCKKYGYALLFNRQRGVMTLAKIDAMGHAFPIAHVERIMPTHATYEIIDWTGSQRQPPKIHQA